MNLKHLLGKDFHENLTLAEIDTLLAGKDLVERSQAESDANNKMAAQKRLYDKALKELAAERRKNTDAGAENANLMERIAALEEAERVSARLTNIATHKASLLAQGYAEDLAASTAEALVDGNTAVVLANQGKFLEAKTQSLKDELLRGTLPPAAGGSGSGPIDYARAKADAIKMGDDLEYLRLCREEAEGMLNS